MRAQQLPDNHRRPTTPSDRALCVYLAWDSAFFGFPIARLNRDELTPERVVEADAWCRANDIHCLYFLAGLDYMETIPLAERNGFNLVNLRVDTVCPDLSPWRGQWAALTEGDGEVRLRLGRPEDVEPLSRIAAGSFSTTRFVTDHRFPQEKVRQMYAAWVKSSFGGYADAMIVAEVRGEPVGYMSLHLKSGDTVSRLSLMAVDAAQRGRGLGSLIIQGTNAWLAEQGVEEVWMATQGQNRTAQRLFQRFGYLSDSIKLYYHKWYDEPRSRYVAAPNGHRRTTEVATLGPG